MGGEFLFAGLILVLKTGSVNLSTNGVKIRHKNNMYDSVSLVSKVPC